MAKKTKNAKLSGKKKVLIWAVSIIGLLALTWCTMLYNDYNRVMNLYLKPAFCINFDPTYQEYRSIKVTADTEEEAARVWNLRYAGRYLGNYGYYQGLGYSVELSGSFFPYGEKPEVDPKTKEILHPWPGILQARFFFMGKEIGRVDREYPPDAGRTEDWQMREIF